MPPGTPLSRLSQGERQLVEIAKALGAEARDRHLRRADHLADRPRERAPVRRSSAGCKAQGIAVIYISHILGDVMRLCDDITVLRDGHVVGQARRGRADRSTG